MTAKDKPKKEKPLKVNHHFIFIEAPIDLVAPEVVAWGESSWWPKKCSTTFSRTEQGPVQLGTKYKQKVLHPYGPAWDVEVTELVPQECIKRTFLNGFFVGYEIVKLEQRSNGTRIDYEMHYNVRALHNVILWKILFEGLHNRNLKLILDTLKEHITNTYKEQREKELEGDS